MKVWIDISNAPHVRFFKDVIKYLEAEGEDVIVTARQFGDIHKLMEMYDIDFISVGKHGVSLYDKLRESTERVYNLVDIINGEKVDVALSKHSIELPRISFGLGIPSLYVLDNEHALAANKLTLPLCDRIITPKIIDMWKLMKFGADPNTIISYDGTSELMHFKSFEYNDNVFDDLNLELKHPKTILMRPEPSLASYLNTDCRKSVLSPIVDELKNVANILILPRFKEQAEIFEGIENVSILKPPVDTSSIIKKSDLVIGAGGTMNREAAILQTPVISCYPGDTLSVDQYYINKGLMFRSIDTDEVIEKALDLIVKPHEEIDVETMDNAELMALLQAIMQKLETDGSAEPVSEGTAEEPVVNLTEEPAPARFEIYENKKITVEALPAYMFIQKPTGGSEKEHSEGGGRNWRDVLSDLYNNHRDLLESQGVNVSESLQNDLNNFGQQISSGSMTENEVIDLLDYWDKSYQ